MGKRSFFKILQGQKNSYCQILSFSYFFNVKNCIYATKGIVSPFLSSFPPAFTTPILLSTPRLCDSKRGKKLQFEKLIPDEESRASTFIRAMLVGRWVLLKL